jgi:hypothetical protein
MIDPNRVRYIKLGREGSWEKECLEKGIVRFGFGTAKPTRFALCRARQWDELRRSIQASGKSQGATTNIVNQTKAFFDDDGSTLWISLIGEWLYWGFLGEAPAECHDDGDGVWRSMVDGWKCHDIKGNQLTKDRLSGALTKLASYRGTSCDVDVSDYVVRRINGQRVPDVETAEQALAAVKTSVIQLMTHLGWRDFETLVDLVFATSGWRRLGPVGKTQKTLDLDLQLPSTGERAFVQIKSQTTSSELAGYIEKFDQLGPYNRMFFVYHTGEAKTEDERVSVIGPDRLADLIIDAGLTNWLIRKVS